LRGKPHGFDARGKLALPAQPLELLPIRGAEAVNEAVANEAVANEAAANEAAANVSPHHPSYLRQPGRRSSKRTYLEVD